jgi:glycosyltransferase involved in cell wall biosynthesis
MTPTASPAAQEGADPTAAPAAAANQARLRILLPHIQLPSFLRADLQILASRHEVVLAPCRPIWRLPAALQQCLASDLVFCWFGSTRFLPVVLLARLLRKPVVVVAGGYDVAAVAEINYGNMRGGLTRLLGRWLFRAATAVLPYSQAAAREACENVGVDSRKQQMIYLGFDPAQFPPPRIVKQQWVLTVAAIDESTIHRKGLLTVAAVSRLMPDVPFVIAGRGEPAAMEALRTAGGPNLRLPGFVSDAELSDLYARAKVYFQPSVHEAFGCSVAEAMLYNCIPVVTAAHSLPEVVGGCGYYVSPGEAAAMVATVRRALDEGLPPGCEDPRARILREFPSSRRAAALQAVIDRLTAERW